MSKTRIVVCVVAIVFLVGLIGNPGVEAQEPKPIIVVVGFDKDVHTELIEYLGGKVVHRFNNFPFVRAELPEDKIDQLLDYPEVVSVEKPVPMYPLSSRWNIDKIEVPIVRDRIGDTGAEVHIGIIDSGIAGHPVQLAGGISMVGGDPYSDPLDHGTAIAGIIAEIAPYASLYSVQVTGGITFCDVVAEGIDWCIDNGMDIINISLGSSYGCWVLESACISASIEDILMVAAAGYGGQVDPPESSVYYPARYNTVMAIGAIDRYDELCPCSSTGSQLDLVAPGVDIYAPTADGGYDYFSGTSFAAPHVTGVAALIRSVDPTMENTWVRYRLRNHAVPLGCEYQFGMGLVNAWLAVPRVVVSLTRTTSGNYDIITANVTDNMYQIGLPLDGATVELTVYYFDDTEIVFEQTTDENGVTTFSFPSSSNIEKVIAKGMAEYHVYGQSGIPYWWNPAPPQDPEPDPH